MKKILISVSIIFFLSFVSLYVLAEQTFNTTVSLDKEFISETNEEFNLTLSVNSLPDEGLSTGQFYIEFDNTMFQVENTDGIISEDSIEYKQGKNNNFFNSITTTGSTSKITILIYDNSGNLKEPLNNGDLISIKFKYIGTKTGTETLNISGEGFSTIQNDKIVNISSTFNNATIQIKDKSISINDDLDYFPNKQYDINKIFDVEGGKIEANVTLDNVSNNNLTYVLNKNGEDENIINKVNVKLDNIDSNKYKLTITIPENALESGNYLFKIISGEVESNQVSINIDKFIPISGFNIKYNNENIENLKIITHDTIDLDIEIIPDNATDKKIIWELGNNMSFTDVGTSTLLKKQLQALNEGKSTITIKDSENKVSKTINVDIISPTNIISTTTPESNITGNNAIDTKYGGTFKTNVKFTNVDEQTELKIKLFDSDDSEVQSDKYEITDGKTIINNNSYIKLKVGNNQLAKGTYKVKFEYNLNDTKKTKKDGEYDITINDFIPINSIDIDDNITLIKDVPFPINYSISPDNATYKKLNIETDN